MREIKFRAWHLDHSGEYSMHESSQVMSSLKQYIGDSKVMQCTGVKDKTGQEIYEGDVFESELCLSPDGISSAHSIFYWIKARCVVEFVSGSFVGRWFIDGVTRGSKHKFSNRAGSHSLNDKITVLGNIHENPELI